MKKAKSRSKKKSSTHHTRREASVVLGCSVAYVGELVARGRLEETAKGVSAKSLADCAAAKAAKAAHRDSEGASEARALMREQTLFRRAKRRMAERELRKARGDLMSRDEVNQSYLITCQAARHALFEWTSRLPEKLAGQDVRDIAITLDKEIRTVLEDMSARLIRSKEPDREKTNSAGSTASNQRGNEKGTRRDESKEIASDAPGGSGARATQPSALHAAQSEKKPS